MPLGQRAARFAPHGAQPARVDILVTIPGYGVLNVGTTYRLGRGLSVLARLNNVTDKTYSLANGYTTPGRHVFVALNWND